MNDEQSLLSIVIFVSAAVISTVRLRVHDQEGRRSDIYHDRNGRKEDVYVLKRTRNRLSFDQSYPYSHTLRMSSHTNSHHHFEYDMPRSLGSTKRIELKSYPRLDDLMEDHSKLEMKGEEEINLSNDQESEGISRLDLSVSKCASFDSYRSNEKHASNANLIRHTGSFTNDDSRFAGWRSNYNSKIMPNKIILVRHGQSEGNVNGALYDKQPDNNIRLTKLGWEQAKSAGQVLRNQILQKKNNSNETVHFVVSPYVRTMETFHGLASAWCDPDEEFGLVDDLETRKVLWYKRLAELGVTWHEDPRIREQDFGNFQNKEVMKKSKAERHKFGVFYYRFPNGESASDVYDRVSTFLDSLWRSFDANRAQNYILVTHGISIRVLLKRYFRYSIDQFNMLANPRNCEMIIIGHDGNGRLELDGRCELHHDKGVPVGDQPEGTLKDVPRIKFYKKLRVVPKYHKRSRTVRLSYA